MKRVCAWFRLMTCMVLLGLVIGVSGCAWLKAGDPLDQNTTLEDGTDAAEIDVDDPINPEDTQPSPGALP